MMKQFVQLFTALDQTTKTLTKVKALITYLKEAREEDKLWAIALLSHRRPKRTVNASYLGQWAAELSKVPEWLFVESYAVVGDLAETITLVLPDPLETSDHSLTYWIEFIKSLESFDVEEKKRKIIWAWERLDKSERFVFNKIITGSFRVGVSQLLMVKALAQYTNVKESRIAHRLMGNWSPAHTKFDELIYDGIGEEDISKPYPFYLAYSLDDEPESLGDPADWIAERKWDGIRGQVVVRENQLFVWSRGEELVTEKYPEYNVMLNLLPNGTVLDGEILPFKDNLPLAFSFLQTRIGRKVLNTKILKDVPVSFVVYDLLEYNYEDWRQKPMWQRRQQLESILNDVRSEVLRLSPILHFTNWDELRAERSKSREFVSEGIMLKRKDSVYGNGRRRGDWWKWKVDPLSIDAVMIYAMRGSGRRANLYTDYTFAVWQGDQLVPFTKAYSGLTDEEIRRVDRWIKANTLERYGPVRSVKPELVFEINFEGIARSSRHKAGIALRFPRISRWREDKPVSEANTIDDLKMILDKFG